MSLPEQVHAIYINSLGEIMWQSLHYLDSAFGCAIPVLTQLDMDSDMVQERDYASWAVGAMEMK